MPLDASRAAVPKTRSSRLISRGGTDERGANSRSCAKFASFAFSNRSNSTRHNAPNHPWNKSASIRGIRVQIGSKQTGRGELEKQIPAFGENGG
jgi:hypothetical protein